MAPRHAAAATAFAISALAGAAAATTTARCLSGCRSPSGPGASCPSEFASEQMLLQRRSGMHRSSERVDPAALADFSGAIAPAFVEAHDAHDARAGCVEIHEQCGGVGWSGPTCCARGLVCHRINEWWSGCRKEEERKAETTTTTTSTAAAFVDHPASDAVFEAPEAAGGVAECAAPHKQCGGISWSGPVCCTDGYECRFQNDWWSGCDPVTQHKQPTGGAPSREREPSKWAAPPNTRGEASAPGRSAGEAPFAEQPPGPEAGPHAEQEAPAWPAGETPWAEQPSSEWAAPPSKPGRPAAEAPSVEQPPSSWASPPVKSGEPGAEQPWATSGPKRPGAGSPEAGGPSASAGWEAPPASEEIPPEAQPPSRASAPKPPPPMPQGRPPAPAASVEAPPPEAAIPSETWPGFEPTKGGSETPRADPVPSSPPEDEGTWIEGTWTTGYWDCCKPSCSWPNKGHLTAPIRACNVKTGGVSGPSDKSACDGGDSAACADQQPFVVPGTGGQLSMGFAAAAVGGKSGLSGDTNCGQCFELRFLPDRHPNGGWGGSHPKLVGRRMVIQVTNIGYDVTGDHSFDLQIPGAGLGIFKRGCARQFPAHARVDAGAFDCGMAYGGCGSKTDCSRLPKDLQAGCHWRYDWLRWGAEGAGGRTNNPYIRFRRVRCPAELVALSGAAPVDDDQFPEIRYVS
mmetsp:Transcript_78472/g.227789  ORF Transcript_78472/g.227789 Transcript_78472/m.227789 type:complete len:686 (+) Transcript_78472:66-2123(+)